MRVLRFMIALWLGAGVFFGYGSELAPHCGHACPEAAPPPSP